MTSMNKAIPHLMIDQASYHAGADTLFRATRTADDMLGFDAVGKGDFEGGNFDETGIAPRQKLQESSQAL